MPMELQKKWLIHLDYFQVAYSDKQKGLILLKEIF